MAYSIVSAFRSEFSATTTEGYHGMVVLLYNSDVCTHAGIRESSLDVCWTFW